MRKELVNNYLFLSVDSQARLLKISAVTNIQSFRAMMKDRYPSYEIINDNFPLRLNVKEQLIYKLMEVLNDCKSTEGNKYRTYHLDRYKVQIAIKLITGSKNKITGYDELRCNRCRELFEADYSRVQTIYDFVRLDFKYCSEECIPLANRPLLNSRYCRCGDVFKPTHATDFYCPKCRA